MKVTIPQTSDERRHKGYIPSILRTVDVVIWTITDGGYGPDRRIVNPAAIRDVSYNTLTDRPLLLTLRNGQVREIKHRGRNGAPFAYIGGVRAYIPRELSRYSSGVAS